MRTKSSENAPDPQPAAKTAAQRIEELEQEHPTSGAGVEYEGPPFGMLRELDFVALPPDQREVVQALGRHLWRHFQRVHRELLFGVEAPYAPFTAVLEAVAAELAFTAKTLATACAAEASAPDANQELLAESLRSVERIKALVETLEARVRLEEVPQP